jgi:TPR repeat protein
VDVQSNAPSGHCPKCLLTLGLDALLGSVVAQSEESALPAQNLAHEAVHYFGDYELLEQIGRGGMGIVYKARQRSLNRIVALKMISAGEFASPSAVQRFQIEAEAAAKLDHPNIVPIYEIGVHRRQHYFSMKFVEGCNLAEEIRDGKLRFRTGNNSFGKAAERERQLAIAQLMTTVAHSVHYAHQHGVLHRDLKPGNILVDVEGLPYLTDFGLAKLLEHELGVTQSAETMGTPSYMSPEQAAGRPLTTATDVYSLGAILYALLTGQPPFVGPSAMEVLRQLAAQEPVPPQSLNPALNRDLATICLKCLGKDPLKRYASAEHLADELDRFVANEPIHACPATRPEKVWRWCERKPALAGTLAGLLLVIAIGLAGFLWEWRQARASESTAMTEAITRQHVATFLTEMFEGVRPSIALGRDATLLREILDKAAARVAKDPNKNHPQAEANLCNAIGVSYLELGEYVKAEAMFRVSLGVERRLHGSDHIHITGPLDALGRALQSQGRFAEAEAMHREALGIARKLRRPEQSLIAAYLFDLAGALQGQAKLREAEACVREALGIRKGLPGADLKLADTLNLLGVIIKKQGRFPDSEAMFRQCLAIQKKFFGQEHPAVSMTLGNLAVVLQDQGKLQEAETIQRAVIALDKRLFGEKHPALCGAVHNLGVILVLEEKWVEAETALRQALLLGEQSLRSEHPDVLNSLNSLAGLFQLRGNPTEAEVMYREILRRQEKMEKVEDPADFARTQCNLALVLQTQGKDAESLALHREALSMRRKLFGNEHPDIAESLNGLAGILEHQGKLAEAEALVREALSLQRKFLGNKHERTASSLGNLAFLLEKQEHLEQAEGSYTEALAIYKEAFGSNHTKTLASLQKLAFVLVAEGKFAKAEVLYREAINTTKHMHGNEHPDLADAINQLGSMYHKQGKLPEAEARYREALSLRKNLAHRAIAESWSNLGLVLLDQRMLPEAETAYRAAVEAGRAVWGDAPLKLRNSMENLAATLEHQKKYEEAETVLIENNTLLQRSDRVSAEEKVASMRTLSSFYRTWAVAAPGTGKIQKSMEWSRKVTHFNEALNGKEALAELRARAEAGNATSEYQLGGALYTGQLGLTTNYTEAAKWFRKAAEQNHPDAQLNLGIMCYQGQDTAKDYLEAVKWFRSAAEQNSADAQYNLGVCYGQGQGVVKDDSESVRWFAKAAEQGVATAQYCLGFCYAMGRGVAKDFIQAAKWYRKAAEHGDAAAQRDLGRCYATGVGIAKNEAESVKWYRKSASQNDAGGQNALAWCLATSDDPAIRDGSNAVVFAEKAVAATQRSNPANLDTLAAAYAEIGQFQKAVGTQKEAMALLKTDEETKDYTSRLALYEAKVPYRAKK